MNRRRPLSSGARIALFATCCCLACAALLASTGCSEGTEGANSGPGSGEATVAPGIGMGGPAVDVNVSQEVLDAKPKPADHTTPESAVRSYLDWTSYAYRIGFSAVATSTMTPSEEVRVSAYTQLNLQKGRLIDQTLVSITFGESSVGTTNTLVPAKEQWTYSYLSIAIGNKVLEGPYTVGYDATYSVVKDSKGVWLVDSVKATPLGPVK
jgi:hypothetical protein